MSAVAIVQDNKIEEAIAKAMAYFSVEPLVLDKIVAVKPNDTWADENDRTAVTQPDSLRAVLRFVKQFHPRQLVVTGGAGAGETDEIFRLAGLMQVVEEEEAEFFDHNRPPFKEVPLEYAPDKDVAGPQKIIMVNPRVLTYETLITLNQLKVHETAT
jgi:uncharacterized protein (DUF362 family)